MVVLAIGIEHPYLVPVDGLERGGARLDRLTRRFELSAVRQQYRILEFVLPASLTHAAALSFLSALGATILSLSSGIGRRNGIRERLGIPTTAVLANERIVPVDLARESRPTGCEISQNLSLRFAVRRPH
jgi:hypothetical protein